MELTNNDLNNYPWLAQAYQDLVLPFNHDRIHHALIIKYIFGSGEDKLITKFTNRLLCLSPTNNEPCLQCHSCQLLIAKNHPDYYLIEPENNKQSISVDQMRQLSSKIYEHAQQGGNKVIWIKKASLLTEAAANALLKTLEEPPKNTYFVLSDIHNGHLLPTIRSRCQYYFLAVPELEVSINWLKSQKSVSHYHDNEIATALLLNSNAPLSALNLLATEQWQKRILFNQNLQTHLVKQDFWGLRDNFINQDDLLIRLHWFCTLLSDGLKATQKSGRFIINRDQVPLVRLIARLDSTKIIALYQLWHKVQEQLATITGLNQELIIMNLLAQSEIIIQTSAN